ncbi:MAG: M48 family metallopeptidase [Patescibacteria group bacterium]
MERRLMFVVTLLLTTMMVVLGIFPAIAKDDYPSFQKVSKGFDAEVYRQMGGPNGERFITSGSIYNRVHKVAKKLGCPYWVCVVKDDNFNACAAMSYIYVNSGAVKACPNDSILAVILGHEITHIAHGHLERQYDKQVRDAQQIDQTIDALNKPGYEGNAKVAAKIAKPLLKLSALRYSREDEYDADLGGFLLAINQKYSKEEALEVFSLMGRGSKGVLNWVSTHPPSDKRKARLLESLPKAEAEEARIESIKSIVGSAKVIDSEHYAKMAISQDFSGYTYRKLMNDGPVYVLAKGGQGEMPIEGKAIVLPKNAKEVILLIMNPKPDNYIGLTASVILGKTNSVMIFDEYKNKSCRHLAVLVSSSSLLQGDQIRVCGIFSKAPVSPEAKGITVDSALKFAFRSRYLNFKQ